MPSLFCEWPVKAAALAGIFLLSAGAAPVAHAAECTSRKLNQMEMNDCAAGDAARSDSELNRVYGALIKAIGPEDQERVRAAQRAWIIFADKECVMRTGGGLNQEGTLWPKLVSQCRKELSDLRIRDLKAQLKCPSWDLSCPAD